MLEATRVNPYHYTPSNEAALYFTCFFRVATAVHNFIVPYKRIWHFIPLAIGGIRESPFSFLRSAVRISLPISH
jgi:hypothetical protein